MKTRNKTASRRRETSQSVIVFIALRIGEIGLDTFSYFFMESQNPLVFCHMVPIAQLGVGRCYYSSKRNKHNWERQCFFCADLLSTGQYSLFYILSRDPIVQIGDVTEMVFTISPRNNHKSSGMIIVEYLQ